MSKRSKPTKPYDQMTAAELREATREFDESGVMSRSRPLSAKDRALHRPAKKMGRPKTASTVGRRTSRSRRTAGSG